MNEHIYGDNLIMKKIRKIVTDDNKKLSDKL